MAVREPQLAAIAELGPRSLKSTISGFSACESGLSVECIFAGEFQWSQGGRTFWLMGLNEGGSAQYLLDGEVIV